MTADISRLTLGDLAEQRANELGPRITVFRGEIPDQPPLITHLDGTVDDSGRVAKYLVLFTGAGDPIVEADLADSAVELDWSFTTLCVAGYEPDCADLVDAVHGMFFRWSPVIAGLGVGRCHPPAGFDPGGIVRRTFPGLQPRFELPLSWRLTLNAS